MGEILLLRHSATAGNAVGRYIGGRTDEPLCPEGRALLKGRRYPAAARVYVSPMKRCVETAELIWPEAAGRLLLREGLRECDFGEFENKNYQELAQNPAYQAWIDSGGLLAFPGGESRDAFQERCRRAFAKIVRETAGKEGLTAIVAHGGTVMAVLSRYGIPKRDYFDYQVKNGEGYLMTPVEGTDLWNYQYLQ